MTPAEIETLADRSAAKAIQQFFVAIGVDATDPQAVLAMQKDFAYLRTWRESIDMVRKRGILTAVTVLVTGGLGLAYALFSHKF